MHKIVKVKLNLNKLLWCLAVGLFYCFDCLLSCHLCCSAVCVWLQTACSVCSNYIKTISSFPTDELESISEGYWVRGDHVQSRQTWAILNLNIVRPFPRFKWSFKRNRDHLFELWSYSIDSRRLLILNWSGWSYDLGSWHLLVDRLSSDRLIVHTVSVLSSAVS